MNFDAVLPLQRPARAPPWLATLAAPTALALAAALALGSLVRGEAVALGRIELVGALHEVTPASIDAAAAPYLEQSFWGVDVEALRAELARLPWVARVRVERHWPAALRITVWERQPYARWNEQAVLDANGVAFTPEPQRLPQGLPRLSGPVGQEVRVKSSFEHLSAALAQGPFALAALHLDARGEWSAETLSGLELRLGQQAPEQQLPLLLGPVSDSLRSRVAELRYIDLRYSNGFAVGWIARPRTAGGTTRG